MTRAHLDALYAHWFAPDGFATIRRRNAIHSEERSMHGEAERVRIQNKRFYEALSSQNILSMEKVWSRSDYVRCVHPGWRLLEGWNSIRDSWRTIFTNAICLTVEPETADVDVHGPIAVVTCRERISSFTLDGSNVTKALATNIFEKREGRWLMILHHASPMVPDGESQSGG